MTIQPAMLCDHEGCDSVFAADTRISHTYLTRQAHDEGWVSIHRNGAWSNLCPEHTKEAA